MAKFWVRGRGRLIVPMTGVAHVQVPPAAKATISLICDNSVNLWTLNIEGVACELKHVVPGFTSLPRMAAVVRQHAMDNLQPHAATGGLFVEQHHDDDDNDDAVVRLKDDENSSAWKSLMGLVSQRDEHIKLM